MNLKELKILAPTPNEGVEEGEITEEILNKHGVLTHVRAIFAGGKERSVPLLARENGKVLVPEKEIPNQWREILKAHPELVVVYTDPHLEKSPTTLAHRGSLETLRSRIESIEFAEVFADNGELWEGKPSVDHCETIYSCAGIEIDLPEEPNRYQ